MWLQVIIACRAPRSRDAAVIMADWLNSNMPAIRFNAPMVRQAINAFLMATTSFDLPERGHEITEGVVAGIVEFAGIQVGVLCAAI